MGADTVSLAYTPLPYAPIAQFAHVDPALVTVDNPGGFAGLSRRIDTDKGCIAFVREIAEPCAEAGVQGIILWTGGIHPRGVNYRPDMFLEPSAVRERLPWLIGEIRALDMWAGCLIRPGIAAVVDPSNTDQDREVELTPEATVSYTLSRIRNLQAVGFEHFYGDEFGMRPCDLIIARRIRAAIGPTVNIWAEAGNLHPGIEEYVGLYSERLPNGKTVGPHNRPAFLESARSRYPDASVLCIAREEMTHQGVVELGYTPLVQDYEAAKGTLKGLARSMSRDRTEEK